MTTLELLGLVLIGIASFGMAYVGAAVGLVLGHFRVVLFTYVLGSPAAGAATSMAVSTVSTLAGAARHARSGRVQVRPLLVMGLPSALSAYAAAQFAARIDAQWLKLGIALALVIAAVDLASPAGRVRASRPVPVAAMGRASVVAFQVLVGTALGAISGLVGLLLGSVRLPAMVRLGVSPATAIGTNMAIGAITGFSGGASAVLGGHVHTTAFVVVAPLAVLGSHLGAKRTGALDATTLTRWIAVALAVTAVVMLGDVALAWHRG